MKKLKRAVIKEEFVELTGNYKLAILLNQFLYWTERIGIDRYKNFIAEENKRPLEEINKLQAGWIYKKSEELSEELMLNVSVSTIRRHLKKLIKQGYILERNNPDYKWDKTKQYRVNLLKIIVDLNEKGYQLQEFKNIDKLINKIKKDQEPPQRPNLQNESPYSQNDNSYKENERALPEITTEITSEITKRDGKQEIIDSFSEVCSTSLTEKEIEKIKQKTDDDELIIDTIEEMKYHNNIKNPLKYLLTVIENKTKESSNQLNRIKKMYANGYR